MSSSIGFGLVSTVIIISALFVVRSQSLVHSVLWLAVTLLGTAGLYAELNAPFIAGVQVLTYVGGVVTLMVFGVMVTRRHESTVAASETGLGLRGFIAAAALFVLLALAIYDSPISVASPSPAASTRDLARALLDEHLVAFEVLSLLLLAAIVGAVVLARRQDPDPATGAEPGATAPTRATSELHP